VSISCTAVGNCTALGSYLPSQGAGNFEPAAVLKETAGKWSATRVGSSILNSVSCVSIGNA
jgi:hypothetical protein